MRVYTRCTRNRAINKQARAAMYEKRELGLGVQGLHEQCIASTVGTQLVRLPSCGGEFRRLRCVDKSGANNLHNRR